jgi:hypothetical protein
MDTGGSLRQVRLGNVEAAHKNKIIAMGRTTSSLNTEIMARLRPLIGSGHDAIFMVNASLIAKPLLSAGRVIQQISGRFFAAVFFVASSNGPARLDGMERGRWRPQPIWRIIRGRRRNTGRRSAPFHRGAFASYRADRNAIASTTTHPMITRAATAPAVILSFALAV